MSVHHNVVDTNALEECFYCHASLEGKEWTSVHDRWKHYKRITCDCKREHWVRVPFEGSGHDDWDGFLEKKIERLL
ncbi:MAG: hypothetical protein ABIH34_05305 [Nanoarchaeota archaeon]